jgi:hypothetical protein
MDFNTILHWRMRMIITGNDNYKEDLSDFKESRIPCNDT